MANGLAGSMNHNLKYAGEHKPYIQQMPVGRGRGVLRAGLADEREPVCAQGDHHEPEVLHELP